MGTTSYFGRDNTVLGYMDFVYIVVEFGWCIGCLCMGDSDEGAVEGVETTVISEYN